MSNTTTPTVFYRTLNVEELEIFSREATELVRHHEGELLFNCSRRPQSQHHRS